RTGMGASPAATGVEELAEHVVGVRGSLVRRTRTGGQGLDRPRRRRRRRGRLLELVVGLPSRGRGGELLREQLGPRVDLLFGAVAEQLDQVVRQVVLRRRHQPRIHHTGLGELLLVLLGAFERLLQLGLVAVLVLLQAGAELLELPLSVAPSLPLLPQSTLAAVSELVVGVTLRGLRLRVAALTLRGFGLGLAALAAGQFR